MRTLACALLIACGFLFPAFSQTPQTVPHLINYQGLLVDANGNPLPSNNYVITFNIFSDPSAATRVWGPQIFDGQNAQGHGPTVPVINGQFNLVLGQVDTNGNDIANAVLGTNRYLQITVGGTTNIVPLQQMLSAPYALRAGGADAADNLSAAGYNALFGSTNSNGAFIPGTKIQSGSITANQIAVSAVGSSQIATGAITTSLIASNAISGDKLQLPLNLVGAQVSWLLNAHNTAGPALAGVSDLSHGVTGSGAYSGVYGTATGPTGYGVRGVNPAGGGGVYAEGSPGIYGVGTGGGYAGQFVGSITVSGAKSFKIDDPLDPANKYLLHACIESSEMKNLYDGIAVLDSQGEAVVQLPAWFEALNKDFRYQLTSIGAPAAELYIAEELKNNRFKIAGGKEGLRVSWQITGTRHDAWASAHPLVVEEEKTAAERGTYLAPEEHGQPKQKSVIWKLRQTPIQPQQ